MKIMNNKSLLILCSILFFNIPFSAIGQTKIMQCIPVKNVKEKRNIIPFNKDFFNEIQRVFNVEVFVETGTYRGDTCEVAATVFNQVHTIELSEMLCDFVRQRFAQSPQVAVYQGDSGAVLRKVLSGIEISKKVAILLDSHWSGGDTAQGFDVPILRELSAIKQSGFKNSIIVIDDIRCFQRQPMESNDTYQYPELSIIINHIREINADYICMVYGDVLIAYTDHDVTMPAIVQAMTKSRLNKADDESLALAESIIANVCDEDFNHLAHLANDLDISTGPWRTHYYAFWYALALYKRGYGQTAYQYMAQAAHQGFNRAQMYLKLWK